MINHVLCCRFQADLFATKEKIRPTMSETDTRKVLLGLVLLVAGTAVLLSGQFTSVLPSLLGSVAALGLGAGALLLGTARRGRPV